MRGWTVFVGGVTVTVALGCGVWMNADAPPVDEMIIPVPTGPATSSSVPTGDPVVDAASRGVYQSEDDVNCDRGGATVVITGHGMYAESLDSTCTRASMISMAVVDGPFTTFTMADGDTIRIKSKPDALTISGDDAGYLAGNYKKDTSVQGAEAWTAGPATEVPAAIQQEFRGCPTVNCTGGVVVTLTASSFYTESSDTTCSLSGKADSIHQDGPYTILTVDNDIVTVRQTDIGIRVGGEDAGYLAGEYQGSGGDCPAVEEEEEEDYEGYEDFEDFEEWEGEEETDYPMGDWSPCEQYAQCCSDYASALGDLAGMGSVQEAQEQACDLIDAMADLPGGHDACAQALNAMQQAMTMYASVPGFDVPGSCQ